MYALGLYQRPELGVLPRIVPRAELGYGLGLHQGPELGVWTRIVPRAELGYGLGLYQWSELGVWTKVAPRARVRCMDQDCSKGQSYVYGLGLYQGPELRVWTRIGAMARVTWPRMLVYFWNQLMGMVFAVAMLQTSHALSKSHNDIWKIFCCIFNHIDSIYWIRKTGVPLPCRAASLTLTLWLPLYQCHYPLGYV